MSPDDRANAEVRDPPATVGRLAVRQEIREVAISAAYGMDDRDGALLRSAFWPDATVQYGTLPPWSADALVERWLAAASRCEVTQHHLFNGRVEVDGDEARAETYYIAALVPAADDEEGDAFLPFCGRITRDEVGLQGGRYVDQLQRRGGAWRIVSRRVCGDWFATARSARRQASTPPPSRSRPGVRTDQTSRRGVEADAAPGTETGDRLLARAAIADCLYRYARAVDRVDADVLRSVLVDSVDARSLAATLVEQRELQPVHSTYITNIRVDLGMDSATAEADTLTVNTDAASQDRDVHLIGGRMVVSLHRYDGDWRIDDRETRTSWRATADGRHIRAFQAATGNKSSRTTGDGSYLRPVTSGVSRTVEELEEREGVRDCLARYARGADRLDRPLLESAFVDVAPQFVEYMFGQADVRPIQNHSWTNLRVELSGGVAFIEAYYISAHGYVDGANTGFIDAPTSSDEINLVAGRYVRSLKKIGERWGLTNLSAAAAYPPPGGGLGDWHAVLSGAGLHEYLAATGGDQRHRGDRSDPSYRQS